MNAALRLEEIEHKRGVFKHLNETFPGRESIIGDLFVSRLRRIFYVYHIIIHGGGTHSCWQWHTDMNAVDAPYFISSH